MNAGLQIGPQQPNLYNDIRESLRTWQSPNYKWGWVPESREGGTDDDDELIGLDYLIKEQGWDKSSFVHIQWTVSR